MQNIIKIALVCCMGMLSISAMAQRAEIPYHIEKRTIEFGIHEGIELTDESRPQKEEGFPFPVFEMSRYNNVSHTIQADQRGAWISIKLGDINLGENSFITVTSAYDGDKQFLNTESLKDWQNQTAYFKGDKVEIVLHVAPNDTDVRIDVKELIVGDFVGDTPIDIYRSQCGNGDNRLTTGIPKADGRMMPLGCTGWIAATGFYLTAGHCLNGFASFLTVFEFDVPASLCDGTTQPAAVNNQYPILTNSFEWEDIDIGDDWGIFNCGANSNTDLTPAEGRRSYYHLSKDHTNASASDILVRGYGMDDVPVGCSGGRNSFSQVLQFHWLSNSNLGETGLGDTFSWEYTVDTEPGNSGSAISLANENTHAIGIHTHGGCNVGSSPPQGNHGTSFEANDVEAAMNNFFHTEVEYVDTGHFMDWAVGSAVRPHHNVQTACYQANAGNGAGRELILIAGSNDNGSITDEGVYKHTFHYSVGGFTNNGVVLRNTVGAVKIGPNATAFTSNSSSVKDDDSKDETQKASQD